MGDELIDRIPMKLRGQAVYLDYDVSIKGQNRQNARLRCAGQPLRER